ncbi:MAG TPA: hypothetical protein VF302_05580, partial [Candidatus Limnocylindrales bacterium]
WIERRVAQPLFDLDLFGIRAFGAGNLAGFLSALGRGGLSFVLVIWLQPQLISAPFGQGLAVAFIAAALMSAVAAWASWLRGGRYVHDESAAELRPTPATPALER